MSSFFPPVKALEIIVGHGPSDLPGPVCPEVEKEHTVTVLDGSHGLSVFHDHPGHHKLIGLPLGVGLLDGRGAAGGPRPLAQKGPVGLLHPVPASIPVHGVIASGDGSNSADPDLFNLFLQVRQVFVGAGGRHVTAIQEGMDEHPLQAVLLGHPEQGIKVLRVAVHAARGNQPHEVQSPPCLLRMLHDRQQSGVGEKLPRSDGLGNAHYILVDNAPSPDIEVTHIGVPHLTVHQPHAAAGSREHIPGRAAVQPVHRGGAGCLDCIAFHMFTEAEAI